MNKTAKYLNALSDEQYREDFQSRLDRISSIPHITDDIRQEMIDDIIVRYDRRDETASFVIEGMVTKRQIDAAYRSQTSKPA